MKGSQRIRSTIAIGGFARMLRLPMLLSLALGAQTGLATPSALAVAQAPLPPQRPAHLNAVRPMSPEQTAPSPPPAPSAPPQTTGSIPPASAEPSALSMRPPHPLNEPGALVARRTAIRICAEEWQQLKKTGSAGVRVWRDFSMDCLARHK